jgi:hypothetical protein
MLPKFTTVAAEMLAVCPVCEGIAVAMAANLDRPSIADPQIAGKSDPVVERIDRVLKSGAAFTGGFFINSHSTLHYAGGTKGANALLEELAKIDGQPSTCDSPRKPA